MTTHLFRLLAVTAVLGVSVTTQTANATPNFPDVIVAQVAAAARPPCVVCHNGGVTGRGTVTTPFGKSMRAHGLVAYDESSLKSALDQIAAEKTDSIGDGTDDIDDLKAGRNPNVPDGAGAASVHVDEPVVPNYGCGARVAPGPVGIPWLTAVLAVAAIALMSRGRLRQWLRIVIASAMFAGIAGCNDPLDVAPGVDLQRFQGKWYEIARLPRSTQADCTATTASYFFASNGDLVLQSECHLGEPTGALKSIAMRAKVDDPSVPAKLSLDIGGFYGDYWILEVGEHYEYAVVGTPSRASLWILSRAPSLDAATTRDVLARCAAKKFDTSRIEYTRHP